MLSPQALEAYLRMTPSERLSLTLQSMSVSLPHLRVGPPEVVDRRFELIRRENEALEKAVLVRAAHLDPHGERS